MILKTSIGALLVSFCFFSSCTRENVGEFLDSSIQSVYVLYPTQSDGFIDPTILSYFKEDLHFYFNNLMLKEFEENLKNEFNANNRLIYLTDHATMTESDSLLFIRFNQFKSRIDNFTDDKKVDIFRFGIEVDFSFKNRKTQNYVFKDRKVIESSIISNYSAPISNNLADVQQLIKDLVFHIVSLCLTGRQEWITIFGDEENTKYRGKSNDTILGSERF